MTIALIHYLQFVCVNCDVHLYKTGIRRAMKKNNHKTHMENQLYMYLYRSM